MGFCMRSLAQAIGSAGPQHQDTPCDEESHCVRCARLVPRPHYSQGSNTQTAGTCLHHKASLKSKVFLCSLRIISSDPANSQGSDRCALAASAVGPRVSQPPCFPIPGCSQAWPGNVQGQVLNPLPAMLAKHAAHDIPPWSHSRLKQCFAHKWAFSGQRHGECSEGIAQG